MPEEIDNIGAKHEAARVLGIPTCSTMHPDDPTPCAVCEPMYLKCEDCGEVWSVIVIAATHNCPERNIDMTFTIVTEEEAF